MLEMKSMKLLVLAENGYVRVRGSACANALAKNQAREHKLMRMRVHAQTHTHTSGRYQSERAG